MKTISHICIMCDSPFKARARAITCSPRCRKRANRAGLSKPRAKDVAGYVYAIAGDVGGVKIGLSANPTERLRLIQMSSPIALRLLEAVYVDDMWATESALHAKYADKRMWGEWFDIPHNEVDLYNLYN